MASSPALESKNVEGSGSVEEKPIPLHENVLQKHAAFFDLNHDGLIYPWETFKACVQLGVGSYYPLALLFSSIWVSVRALALVVSVISITYLEVECHIGIRMDWSGFYSNLKGKFPSLLFPIEVKNIQLGKHGSDTGVYDTEGRFVPSKFEEIFTKHAHTHPNALTHDELKEMIKANREPKDFKGRIGSLVEWSVLYKLAKDKNGLLQKETIRGVYDGSLFELLKKEQSADQKQ